MEIRTGSSDSNSSRHESSSFGRVQRISNESQYGRKKESDVKRELEENGISFFLRKIRKERPNTRNINAHHKRLQPQTRKWKKSDVPTNHGDADATRRTSSIQETQKKELKPQHRRSGNKNTRRRGSQQQNDQEWKKE
ncbi:hypothetical protein TNCV_2952201 [Trichonephila clavipes]|nr:hypothetical protein TNCV_2952201 [Trichonephila clavipes]